MKEDVVGILITGNRATVTFDGETAINLTEEQSRRIAEALQFALDMAKDRKEIGDE